MSLEPVAAPPHVDPRLIVDFDFFNMPGMAEEGVYAAWHKLHDGPDIFWTPRNGGHWVLTRAEDVRWAQLNHQICSNEIKFIPRESMKVVMPPLTVDPPNHARYRAMINPFFSPARVLELTEVARTVTIETIDKIAPTGHCEFVSAFARVMPVTVFLGMCGLPLDRREEFCHWGHAFVDTQDQAVKDGVLREITAYLSQVIKDRTQSPGDDAISRILVWRDNPRFQGEAEIFGMTILLFFAGLDTVANMLAFITHHLATHPEHRRRIIDDPAIIPQAVEEYARRFGLSNTGRLVKQDAERKGACFREGDIVMVPLGLSGMDDREYDRPLEVDFDRAPQPHNTFGNGTHKCVGAPLARSELKIFLEEWLKRIPDFRLDPARPPVTTSSMLNMMTELHLVWDV